MRHFPLLITALLATPALAAEPSSCAAFQMDVATEVELFQGSPLAVRAAGDATMAAAIEPGRLYQVELQPQSQVEYVAAPKRAPDPRESGGMLRVRVPEGGAWRVAVNAPAWVDAVFARQPLQTEDFRSDRECKGPTKIVTFNVPAGAELVLQFVDVDRPTLRLAMTPAPAKIW